MDKQIEEMSKDVEEYVVMFWSNDLYNETARALYNAGYRKIPEGAVVLTREEEQKYLAYKIIEPQIRGCLDRERELEKRLETVRKETAQEFAERLEEVLVNYVPQRLIDEIVKELTGEEQ